LADALPEPAKESNRPRALPSVVRSGLRAGGVSDARIEERRRLCGALVALPAPRAPATQRQREQRPRGRQRIRAFSRQSYSRTS